MWKTHIICTLLLGLTTAGIVGGWPGAFRRVVGNAGPDLPVCHLNSKQLNALGAKPASAVVDKCNQMNAEAPCVLYDTGMTQAFANANTDTGQITVLNIDDGTGIFRGDGVDIAGRKLNMLNGGKGLAIGYSKNRYMRVRALVIVDGLHICSVLVFLFVGHSCCGSEIAL